MRFTPLDIQNHRFGTRLRGYDPAEVDSFMRMVAEDFEAAVREAETLRERVRDLETRVEELSSQERTLRDTLVTAQSLSEDLKRTAMKEAEVTISEAEVKGEKILNAAHRRVARLSEEIRELTMLRTRLATAVRSAIETHLALLDSLCEDAPEETLVDGKVAYLNPKGGGPQSGSAS